MVFECKAAGQCTVIDHLNYARWVTFSIYYVFFSFQIWLILHLQIMVVSFRFFYLFISIECLFHVFSILVFKVSPKNLQLMYTKYSHTNNFDFFYTCILQWWLVIKQRKLIEIFFMNLFFYKYIYSTSNVVVCQNTFYIRTLWWYVH